MIEKEGNLTLEEILTFFSYNPNSGELRYAKPINRLRNVGDLVGNIRDDGRV